MLTIYLVKFEWNESKNLQNQRKHGLSFTDVLQLFDTGDYLEIFDAAHSEHEDRFIAIGDIARGVAVVVFTEREEGVIRIIGARLVGKRERDLYYSRKGAWE